MNDGVDVKVSLEGEILVNSISSRMMAKIIFRGLKDPLCLKKENNDLRKKEAMCNFQWTQAKTALVILTSYPMI